MVAAAAPRRDKFAAQAAAAAAPGRDKFAAQAAARGSKFAAMANKSGQQQDMGTTMTTASTANSAVDPAIAQRKLKLQQERQKVWDDLEKAEQCIGLLLKEVANHGLFDPDSLRASERRQKREKKAAKTKKRLEKEQRRQRAMDTGTDDESDDSSSSEEDDDDSVDEEDTSRPHERYSKILQELHSLCAPHAHWIQAYRPVSTFKTKKKKTEEKKPKISMYQARVEMRLAQEKRNICQEWLRLEEEEMEKYEKEQGGDVKVKKENVDDGGESKKRKLEEVTAS